MSDRDRSSDASIEADVERPPGMLSKLFVPDHIVDITLQGLRLRGDREGLAYWAGRAFDTASSANNRAIVTTVVFPRIESSDDYFRVVDGEMAKIAEWCASADLWILAQIHSHPTDEPHSEADETWPASHRSGYLSIVVPFFAQFSTVLNPFWQVHELLGNGDGWRDVTSAERVRIISSVFVTESR